jgi:ABC-type bacteriocin/lantibiotic exporter with double-glycine peptidase domain
VILKSFNKLFKLLSLNKKEISYLYTYALLIGLISLAIPLGIQTIVSLIIANQVSTSWYVLIIIVTLAVALIGVFQIMQLRISEYIQQHIFARASFVLASKVIRIKYSELYKNYFPETMNRFFDILTIQKGLSKILIDLVSSVLQIVFGLILLAFYHSFFVFFGIFVLAFFLLIFIILGPKALESSLNESKYKYEVVNWLQELARNVDTFKLNSNQKFHTHKIDNLVSKYISVRESHAKILIKQLLNVVVLKTLITLTLLLIGGVLVIEGEINIGQFIASEIIIVLVIGSVEKLIYVTETLYDVLTAVEKLSHVIDLKIETNKGRFSELGGENNEINLKLNSINYSIEEKSVLRDISLELPFKSIIGIMGYGGSGKTTLSKLICGLIDDFNGQFLINGITFSDINIDNYRGHIFYIDNSKDAIFKGSIIENITLGVNYDENELLKILTTVNLLSYTNTLKEGLKYPIQTSGSNLPSSIITKIILARCLFNKPKIIVINNELLTLNKTERDSIFNLLTANSRTWSLVLVSNSKNILMKTERIIVIKDGETLTNSPSQEILNNNLYTDLLN